MKSFHRTRFVLDGMLAVSASLYCQTSHAQDPGLVNPVVSGTYLNTAMGTGALANITPSAENGDQNTAAGYNALHFNTAGDSNVAFGVQALYSNTYGGGNA